MVTSLRHFSVAVPTSRRVVVAWSYARVAIDECGLGAGVTLDERVCHGHLGDHHHLAVHDDDDRIVEPGVRDEDCWHLVDSSPSQRNHLDLGERARHWGHGTSRQGGLWGRPLIWHDRSG